MHDIRPYLPELFDHPGTLLYIGARADSHSWLEELARADNKISVLEIWHQNALDLIDWGKKLGLEFNVYIGDVKYISGPLSYLPFDTFDYIFWWHGPEHLRYDEIEPALLKLEAKCKRALALACPWGVYPQGAHQGNPYEAHQCSLYPEFFVSIGYEFAVDGKPDELGGEIVAWKRLG